MYQTSLRAATARIIQAWDKKGTQAALKISTEWKIVKNIAIDVFHGKCAYCETPQVSELTHHRPKSGAKGFKGIVDPEHYFWLAFEWTNLYLTCGICNSNKRTMFPVEGPRAAVKQPVTSERPLL